MQNLSGKCWRLSAVLVAFLLRGSLCAGSDDFHLDTAGVKYGFGSGLSSSDFHEFAAFVDWHLPWDWDLGRKWHLQSCLDLTAGCVTDFNDDAALLTLGPVLELGRGRFPVRFVASFSPTYISHWEFKSKDLGMPFQVTTDVGFDWDVLSWLRLGYRYQHMSNLGLTAPNPGLNLHMFGLSYRF
jgi:hypothetical protein